MKFFSYIAVAVSAIMLLASGAYADDTTAAPDATTAAADATTGA